MMITLHDQIVQGSPEWLAYRTGKYTGSNAWRLLSSFGAGKHAQSVESDFTGSFHTERGHLLEGECIDLYTTITGDKVQHTGFVTNDDYPECLYSPDGLTDTHVIEVKCFSEKPHMAIYNGDIPVKILAQVHFGMMICDKRAGRLVIYNPRLSPKRAFKITEIAYNQKIIDNFKRILKGADNGISNTADATTA